MENDRETLEVAELGDAKVLTQGLNAPQLVEDNPDFIYRE
jgi:hypothetical protein